MVRSISIYQPKNGIGGREFNQCHIISRQRKNKTIAKLEEALQATRGEGQEEVVILSYNIEKNVRNGEQRINRSKRTVMICDDEKDILLAFAIELQTKYNVLTAESGEQCIKKYLDAKHSGRKIDLILLDYKLGDTTGDYVAHKIKELNDVKIIMITAYEVNHDIVRQLEDNELVIDIVQKPIAIDSLMAKVAQGMS
ncbi:MAG: response regulator [Nitrososphaeraceae archaeon]|jgi:CheY-like chemotaxis protein